jgi:hypothetical protein
MTPSSGRHAIRAAGASIAAASGLAVVAAAVVVSAHDPIKTRVTWTGDVSRVIAARCVSCHYPGVRGTMSLATYEDARPWARAIKTKVVKREMPPWGADPAIGKFANDASLKQSEIDTIAAWVDAGAPEGNRAELPKAPQFAEGWSIGKPDLVFKMTEAIQVPADGTVPYLYVTVPTNLKEDIWVRGIELKPTDRRVVHHIISDLVEDDGKADDPKPKLARDPSRKDIGGVGGLVPGRLYQVMEEGVARKIPAGADIVLQMHYTTIGQGVTDQTEIGVILAKEPPARVRAEGGGQIPNPQLVIPPNHPNFEVTAQRVIDRDTYLTNVYPHMHVRGKDVKYLLITPDGREETILSVPRYDFNWQTSYRLSEPKFMPKGSTLKVIAHYDNSRANRYNPDPSQEVRWGDQTWEEMLIGYYSTADAPAPRANSTNQQQQ